MGGLKPPTSLFSKSDIISCRQSFRLSNSFIVIMKERRESGRARFRAAAGDVSVMRDGVVVPQLQSS